MTKQKSNKEIIRKILGKYLKANMMEYIHAIDKDKPVSSCISTKEDYDKLVSELSQLIPEEGEVIAEKAQPRCDKHDRALLYGNKGWYCPICKNEEKSIKEKIIANGRVKIHVGKLMTIPSIGDNEWATIAQDFVEFEGKEIQIIIREVKD